MNSSEPALNRKAWTLAALETLANGGITAVKVDILAKRLKVSRGSFYWHFKHRKDLLDELLRLWETDLTDQLIANAWSLPEAGQRLRAVSHEAMDRWVHNVDAAKAENALRAWAAIDPTAQATMRRVDANRVAYIAVELERLGHVPAAAEIMARGLYLTLLGLFVARTYNSDLADDNAWMAIVDMVIAASGPDGA